MSKFRQRPTAAELVSRLKKNGECLEWIGGIDKKGYGAVHLGRNRYAKAHRYAYQVLVGSISPGMHILHACDNKLCCNPEHLRQGSNAENMRDRADRTSVKSRKLDREGVRKLRDLRAQGLSYRKIARELGFTYSGVHKVCTGITYFGAQYE